MLWKIIFSVYFTEKCTRDLLKSCYVGAKFSPGESSLLNAYILVFGNSKPNKQNTSTMKTL